MTCCGWGLVLLLAYWISGYGRDVTLGGLKMRRRSETCLRWVSCRGIVVVLGRVGAREVIVSGFTLGSQGSCNLDIS